MQKKKIITLLIILLASLCISLKTYATENDITQNFTDENLRNSILELAKNATGDETKTQIYESDIDKIVEMTGGSSLKLANKGIRDLSGIEAFADKQVTWIFLDWNEITDLTPLKNFKALTKISFSGNQVSDLTPLANISSLENITAINNNINTIDTIKNLSNIKYICLDGNNLTDITATSNWTNLIDMSFQNNKIAKLPNLSKLTNLKSINISNNEIQTINNMANLSNVEKVEIDNNRLVSLNGIQNLTNLKILSCSNNEISDISEIAQLSNIENININKNQIQDISKLHLNTEIEYLYMDNNSILNFDMLSKLNNLRKYSIYNQIISIEIKEKIVGDFILVPLPELFTSLYNSNSVIYEQNLTTEIVGAEYYEIDSANKNVKLKSEDLKNNDISIKVNGNDNTFLVYTIQLDRIAPTVEGVENNQIYFEPVIPTCSDEDIGEVQLIKDNLRVEYSLGDSITRKGKYTLKVSDRAGNQTIVTFEIRNENIESESYKFDAQYIVGISHNTTLNAFVNSLKTEMEYEVYRENTKLQNSDIVATGDRLVTEYGKTFYLVVKGDINKDGNTNISDLVRLRKYILKIEQFSEIEKKAADLTGDNIANITDLVQIRKIIIYKVM